MDIYGLQMQCKGNHVNDAMNTIWEHCYISISVRDDKLPEYYLI